MKEPYFSRDISQFLALCARHDVRYLIVGGEAVIYHGYSRLTGDIDLFYEATRENVQRLYQALNDFWSNSIPGIAAAEELVQRDAVFQFGVPPNRIDLLSAIDGVAFQEAWPGRIVEPLRFEDAAFEVFYIGKQALIKNKRASGRYKDLDDLRYLEG